MPKPSERIESIYYERVDKYVTFSGNNLTLSIATKLRLESIIKYLDEQYELKEAILKEMNNALNAPTARGEER